MSYPGDPSLSPDIQQRVLGTFEETAQLAEEGKIEEARLGCDFVLRLDSLFTPAQRLQERLDASDGPVETADLVRAAKASQASPEVLKTVRLSPEEIQKMMAASEAGASPEPPGTAEPPASEAASPTPPPGNPGEEESEEEDAEEAAAAEASGAEPAADSFLEGARRALESGELDTASRLLEMAGSLDPDDPALDEVRKMLEEATAATPAPISEVGEKSPEIDVEPGLLSGEEEGEEGDEEEAAAGAEEAPESPDKVQELLAEGQRAFDDERYQDAIDSWSRIFLVDIDHAEATRRIELARELKEEQDREVEEIFHRGVAHAEDGEEEQAIRAFNRVLELRPHHLAAREQLTQLGAETGEPVADEAPAEAPAGAAAGPAADDEALEDLFPEAEKPKKADASYRAAARAKRAPVNPFVLIGSAVFVLVLVGVWLLVANWGSLFPNAGEEDAVAPREPRMAQITAMWEGGQEEEAMAALEAISPDSPDYLQARRLLAQWREDLAARARSEEEIVLSGEQEEVHNELIASARGAYGEGEYLQAARLFTRASSMAPLSAAEAALYEDSKRQLEPIAQQIDLYTQRQWELVVPGLWRRLEQRPKDKDVRQLLVNSYYNLAVRELRRQNVPQAVSYIEEAVELDPRDAEMQRLAQFALTYVEYPRDLLYEIFVDGLEFRL